MSFDPYKALYIHIPFCVQRCNYCDFCTNARDYNSPEIDEYVENIILQLKKASNEGKLSEIETIYIGGGTPSYIGNKRLSSIFYAISMFIKMEQIKEFTIEANPESLTENIVKDSWAMGVNRISIGVQSFDDDLLKMLGRAHDSKKALEAINIAKSRFDNISIDLICGIPGQKLNVLEQSLKTFHKLEIPHLSIYPLSIEYNTVFYKWKAQNKIDDIDPDIQADHMEFAENLLKDAGYNHYEVSSYCKEGYESKHNLSYWKSKPYLGIGASATTMTQNSERRMRMTDNNIDDDLNTKEMIAEDLMLAMRTSFGVSNDMYSNACTNISKTKKVFDKLLSQKLIEKTENGFIPTHMGWMCGNDLFGAILNIV